MHALQYTITIYLLLKPVKEDENMKWLKKRSTRRFQYQQTTMRQNLEQEHCITALIAPSPALSAPAIGNPTCRMPWLRLCYAGLFVCRYMCGANTN